MDACRERLHPDVEDRPEREEACETDGADADRRVERLELRVRLQVLVRVGMSRLQARLRGRLVRRRVVSASPRPVRGEVDEPVDEESG